MPCALRDAHRAGNHARRDFRQDLDFAERVLHADLVALLDAALFSVGGVDPRLLRVHFLEQLDAAPRGVRATAIVEAAAAQRELVGGHVGLGEAVRVHRDGRNEIFLAKLPGGGDAGQRLGVDLDLAGRGVQRVGRRIVAERLERDGRALRVLARVDAHLHGLVVRRQLGVLLARLLVELLDPLFLRLALGELLLHAHLVGDEGQGIVEGLALELRRGARLAADHVRVVAAGADLRHLLEAEQVGQQDVGVFGGVRHGRLPHHDELALALVGKDVVRVVDVAMLVRQAVAGVVQHALDVLVELVGARHGGVERRHLGAMVDGLGEQEHGDLRLDGVVTGRQGLQADGVRTLAAAVARARQTDLAGQQRQHHDGPAVQLAVAAALRAPALHDVQRLGSADLGRQLLDAVGGDAADGGGPLGGLLHHVVAGAHDVVLVGLALALGALGHGVLVVADAVGVQELLVHQVVRDQLVRDGGAERGVGAGVDGLPLGGTAHDGIVHAGVDVDHLALRGFAQMHPVVVRHGAALARLGRARAEREDERGVLGGVERAAAEARCAVGVRHDHFHLHGAVVAVRSQATADAVHETRQRASRRGAHARRVGDVHGLVAVLVDDALELAGDRVNGLVPRDLLELAFAALADALHGVVDAVGVREPAAVRTTAQAGARLHLVEAGVLARVGFHPGDLVVLHVELQAATAGTVDGAVAPRRGLLDGLRRSGVAALRAVGARRAAEQRHGTRAHRSRTQAGQRRALHERAARHLSILQHVRHGPSLFHSLVLCSASQAERFALWHSPATAVSHKICELIVSPGHKTALWVMRRTILLTIPLY